MKHTYRFYLETSFWKRLGDPAYHERRKITYRFFRQAERRHKLFLSMLVIHEIAATPDVDERRYILGRVDSAHPRFLTQRRRAERIAEDLLDAGGWGANLFADMVHIGYTIAGDLDAIVTWDEGHIACNATRNVVMAYGRRAGTPAPLIGTPLEIAQWLNIKI
jgi:hypothetical protein